MILLLVEESWMNDADRSEHVIVETTKEAEELKQNLKEKRNRYRSQDFYSYSFFVEEVDINEVKIDELKGLTLKEVKRLLNHVL
jgi:hypothetical protein